MILHLVTDRRRLAPAQELRTAFECLIRQAVYAIDAGVDVIQLRERDLEAKVLGEWTTALLRRAEGTATRILLNDRLDVALAAGAHGVHLPARSLPAPAARRLAPRGFVIGCSVHDASELAAATGADYVTAGTVWPSASKGGDPRCLGPEGLADLVGRSQMPVLAIGGVTPGRCSEVARTGAAGIAAIGLFLDAEGPVSCRARSLADAVRQARERFDTSADGS